MSHDDFATEPVRGLPENLPAGEEILWQGAPDWWQLAKDAFHIRAVALYFLTLMLWRGGANWAAYHNPVFGFGAGLSLLPFALAGLGLLSLLAFLSARTSVYTITNRRVVMRIGVALPTAINIPFQAIASADLDAHANGSGAITLSIAGDDRMAWSNLWPHVRPWRLARPQPMLRAIPRARQVASLLGRALSQAEPATFDGPKSEIAQCARPMASYAAAQDNGLILA